MAELRRRLKSQRFRGSLRVFTEWATRRRRAEKANAQKPATDSFRQGQFQPGSKPLINCTEQVAQIEQARRTAAFPNAGSTARQSVDAQLHHQQTPSSVGRAKKNAAAKFDKALKRAKALDDTGKRAECMPGG